MANTLSARLLDAIAADEEAHRRCPDETDALFVACLRRDDAQQWCASQPTSFVATALGAPLR